MTFRNKFPHFWPCPDVGRGPKDFERGLNGGGTAATARQAAEPRVKSPT